MGGHYGTIFPPPPRGTVLRVDFATGQGSEGAVNYLAPYEQKAFAAYVLRMSKNEYTINVKCLHSLAQVIRWQRFHTVGVVVRQVLPAQSMR